MRGSIRRVAMVGGMNLAVAEALRVHGFRVDPVDGSSVVGVARDLVRLHPAVVHARSSHLKVSLITRLLNFPLVLQAGRGDLNASTARAARAADRTLCGTVSMREALLAQGAPPSSTVVARGLLDGKTDLAGSGDQLPGVLAHAAAVVGPSRSANHPDPVPEALAMGAPVIATAVGPHPTWIREGRTGWLVPARAPAALAARLAQVVDDPQMARRVATAAQRAARELLQPDQVALELARCYGGVARPQATPSTDLYLPEPARAARV